MSWSVEYEELKKANAVGQEQVRCVQGGQPTVAMLEECPSAIFADLSRRSAGPSKSKRNPVGSVVIEPTGNAISAP